MHTPRNAPNEPSFIYMLCKLLPNAVLAKHSIFQKLLLFFFFFKVLKLVFLNVELIVKGHYIHI